MKWLKKFKAIERALYADFSGDTLSLNGRLFPVQDVRSLEVKRSAFDTTMAIVYAVGIVYFIVVLSLVEGELDEPFDVNLEMWIVFFLPILIYTKLCRNFIIQVTLANGHTTEIPVRSSSGRLMRFLGRLMGIAICHPLHDTSDRIIVGSNRPCELIKDKAKYVDIRRNWTISLIGLVAGSVGLMGVVVEVGQVTSDPTLYGFLYNMTGMLLGILLLAAGINLMRRSHKLSIAQEDGSRIKLYNRISHSSAVTLATRILGKRMELRKHLTTTHDGEKRFYTNKPLGFCLALPGAIMAVLSFFGLLIVYVVQFIDHYALINETTDKLEWKAIVSTTDVVLSFVEISLPILLIYTFGLIGQRFLEQKFDFKKNLPTFKDLRYAIIALFIWTTLSLAGQLVIHELTGSMYFYIFYGLWLMFVTGMSLAVWGGTMIGTTIEEGLMRDLRPMSLYLRPFSADTDDLEAGLFKGLKKIGPLIAIGNPGDNFLPPTYGAYRIYIPDEGWKDRIDELINETTCTFIRIGKTINENEVEVESGINWEVRKAFTSLPPEKIILVYGKGESKKSYPYYRDYIMDIIKERGGSPQKPLPEKVKTSKVSLSYISFDQNWNASIYRFGNLPWLKRLRGLFMLENVYDLVAREAIRNSWKTQGLHIPRIPITIGEIIAIIGGAVGLICFLTLLLFL